MHTLQSNKSIKSIRLFLCAICSASLVFSCSKKEPEKVTGQDTSRNIEKADIVGKWVSREDPAEFFLFNGDGTGLRCDKDRPATHPLAVMDWTVPGDGKLLMAFGEGKLHGLQIPALNVSYHYELKGDVMTAWVDGFEEYKTTYDRSGSEGETVLVKTAETNDNASSSPESGTTGNVSLDAIDTFIASQEIDKSTANWKTSLAKPPQVEFEATASYYWNLQTNVGMIKVKLNPQVAPMHVSSTIYLTRLGFYDDVVFHRVIKGFMAQGGDPLGRGTGGPGYNYSGEFSPSVRHDRPGLLSMANAGPGTDGSQFFITFVPTPHLDGNHTIFGAVTEGMDTVKKLEDRGSRSGQTTEDLRIVKASIEVK